MKELSKGTTRPWYVRHHSTQTAGFVREHDNLALITVMGAGACLPLLSTLSRTSSPPRDNPKRLSCACVPVQLRVSLCRYDVRRCCLSTGWPAIIAPAIEFGIVIVCLSSALFQVVVSAGLMFSEALAGHMIPIDQPQAARKMVDMIMKRHAKISKASTAPAAAAS